MLQYALKKNRMTNRHFFTILIVALLGAAAPAQAQKAKQGKSSTSKNDVKFLEDISIDVAPAAQKESGPRAVFSEPLFASRPAPATTPTGSSSIESADLIQFKFSQLLDIEVELVQSLNLFRVIEDWWGAPYLYGGSGRDGIDCSAFMQVLFTSVHGMSVPRTAREQYAASVRISMAELKEGDLVFFNTTGGVSHVGMYLANNRFVHASKNGVTISNLLEEYWSKHIVGAGRMVAGQLTTMSTRP